MIDRARRAEIGKIKGSSFLRAINISLFYVSGIISVGFKFDKLDR